MLMALFAALVFFVATGARAAGNDVSEEVKEAAAAIGEYSVEQKDAAVEKAKEMMDSLDDRIHKLEGEMEANWDDMKQSSREKYSNTMKELRQKRNDLAEWYGSLKHSSKDAWNEVQDGFAKSYDALAQSWEDAAGEMKKGN
jgi:pyruvate/2-oxoacid:ferredoxin oxidoreductase beta subunit